MYTLYEYPPSGNSYKIRLLLHELELEHQAISVDILKRESRTPEFLKMNPNGRIPVLELDCGRTLAESNAIMWYLADGTELLPKGPWDRAKVLEWLSFEQYNLEPNIAVARFWLFSLRKTEAELGEKLSEKKGKGLEALNVLEGGLRGRDYLVGERFSIADIGLYGYTHVAGEGGFGLDDFPNIQAWIKRIEARSNYIAMEKS